MEAQRAEIRLNDFETLFIQRFRQLDEDGQRELMYQLDKLTGKAYGEPGWRVVKRAKDIKIDSDDLRLMEEAINASRMTAPPEVISFDE